MRVTSFPLHLSRTHHLILTCRPSTTVNYYVRTLGATPLACCPRRCAPCTTPPLSSCISPFLSLFLILCIPISFFHTLYLPPSFRILSTHVLSSSLSFSLCIWMCARVCVHMCVGCVWLHLSLSPSLFLCIVMNVCVVCVLCVGFCVHVCVRVCCVCVYLCIYVCMCVYLCMHVCTVFVWVAVARSEPNYSRYGMGVVFALNPIGSCVCSKPDTRADLDQFMQCRPDGDLHPDLHHFSECLCIYLYHFMWYLWVFVLFVYLICVF